jgi:hypothetical protein
MANRVTTSHRNPSPDIVHSVSNSQLALLARFYIVGICFAFQQIRRQQPQSLLRLLVGRFGPVEATERFYAVVERPEPCAKPMIRRCSETQFWIQDYEPRTHAGVQKALFVLRGVICAAGEGEVLAAAQTGRDGDERDFGFDDIGWDIGAFD